MGRGAGEKPRLALTTICLFVKPSMAYVYGFLLVVLIVWEGMRGGGGGCGGLRGR